ncbi:MAG: two-component system response regulator CreB [Nitrospirota bacterium]|nr:two-component system response regulator CreB [Nitrospirota bacterium]
MKKILVIEDEPSILDNVMYALQTEGFEPLSAGTGQEAREILQNTHISLVVLDIGLPDVSGFDLHREIRSKSTVSVIILTARFSEIDKVVGLELGADDYMVKPFSPRELAARVRAVLRRPSSLNAGQRKDAQTSIPFELDEKRCMIRYHGEVLDLSRYEYRLLGVLIQNPGRVFTREQLIQRISEDPDMSFDRSIDTHIKTIRQKLKSLRCDEDPIVTHRGLGYSLKEY